MMDFDPNDPRNIAAAQATQAAASAQAKAAEGDSLPLPPNGLPALRSIPGHGMDGAAVLGYRIVSGMVRDCIRPDGSHAVPGDPGFSEAQCGRLGLAPMPAGWMFEERRVHKLQALVDGNPILLERQARSLGYRRALAVGPNVLDLGEVEP